MSNHSHLHDVEFEKGKTISVDAYGTREECDICRERSGLKPMAEVREQQAAAARGELVLGAGHEATEQLKADLEEAEEQIATLRRQLRDGAPELTQQRDAALERAATLARSNELLEKKLEELQAQIAAATKKK